MTDFKKEHKEILDYALQNMVRRFGKWVYTHREDLYQEGYIGILNAMNTFDKKQKVPENKYKLICAIRSMASYCFKERRHWMNEVALDYLDEILLSSEAESARLLQAYEYDLSDKEKLILDKYMKGAYIIDIAKELTMRKQTVVNIIKDLKQRLRETKYD